MTMHYSQFIVFEFRTDHVRQKCDFPNVPSTVNTGPRWGPCFCIISSYSYSSFFFFFTALSLNNFAVSSIHNNLFSRPLHFHA